MKHWVLFVLACSLGVSAACSSSDDSGSGGAKGGGGAGGSAAGGSGGTGVAGSGGTGGTSTGGSAGTSGAAGSGGGGAGDSGADAACLHCAQALAPGGGPNGLCPASLQLFDALGQCVCSATNCATQCQKSCTGSGSDNNCAQCEIAAGQAACKQQQDACAADAS